MFYNTFQGIAFQQNKNLEVDSEVDSKEDSKEGSEKLMEDLEKVLYPCVGLQSQDGSVEVNFGHKKFKYAGNLFLMISDLPLFNLFYFNITIYE